MNSPMTFQYLSNMTASTKEKKKNPQELNKDHPLDFIKRKRTRTKPGHAISLSERCPCERVPREKQQASEASP